MEYDVAIIGGGPAGYLAAERASEAGLQVLLVEKNSLGGVCLNEGCIPTKALLSSAKKIPHGGADVLRLMEHAEALANKGKVVNALVSGVAAALRAKKVQVVKGSGEVTKKEGQFEIFVGEARYLARQILLATGSAPVIPPIDGLRAGIETGFVMTSREILDLGKLPGSLVVVGGGVIGLEIAAYFRSMGSKVTIVEALPSVGGGIEPEAANFLLNMLKKKGVELYLDAKVTSVGKRNITMKTCQGEKQLPADRILLCVGRRPVLTGFEKLGVFTENGAVKTDDYMRTNLAGVYAAGDVTGKYMLAHVAYREAEVAINNMAGIPDAMDYRAVPGVIYTFPEVAFVGLSEQAARRRYANVSVSKTSINMSGRHMAEQGVSDGFCKLIADKDRNIILGATIVGAYASEIIYSLGLMIQNKIPIDAIKKSIFPHPTVSEIVREGIFSL